MVGIALAFLLQATAAPPAPPPREADITVVAPDPRESVPRLVLSLLNAVDGQQLARFETAVCPGVLGINPGTAATIVQLIRQNATEAGLKLQPEGCAATALVIFTPQPGPVADKVYERFNRGRRLNRFRREWMRTSNDGIRSFQVVDVRTADGRLVTVDSNGIPEARRVTASRLSSAFRYETLASFALVDTDQAAGKTVQQLADVATLHLLLDVNARPTNENLDSILTLFTRDDPPRGLTSLDRGMLKGLYGLKNNARESGVQRGQIARTIREVRMSASE